MTGLRIEPVVEVLHDAEFDLWPVVGRDGFWYLALHGDLTEPEVGTGVHQILRWFYTDDQGNPAPTVEDYLARALAQHSPGDDQPMAMGGLRFTDTVTGATVLPGCCYSVDERSEVHDVLDGKRPACWFGHDPDAGLAVRDGLVEIAQDIEDASRPVLQFAADQVRTALARAEVDLDHFCDRTAAWAAVHAPGHVHTLPGVVARALDAGSHRSTGDRNAPVDKSPGHGARTAPETA